MAKRPDQARVVKLAGEAQKIIDEDAKDDIAAGALTWLAQFVSNDASVAEVSPDGRVKMLRPGETAVRATFLGQVAVVVVTAPHDQAVKPDLLARHEPEEVALPAAVRAVSLDRLRDRPLDLERDPAAVTAAFVGHVFPHRSRTSSFLFFVS